MQAWIAQDLGIRWITLLLDDPNEGPPTANGAKVWKEQYGLADAAVYADPGFSMVPGSSVGTPQFTLIDPRTMTVTFLQEGFGGNEAMVAEQLAMANKAAAGN
jgi:hypothetical protein